MARVAELEERLRKSSSNCSKPPSADSPKHAAERKKQRAKASEGRRPGGQPGRVRCVRAVAPAEQVRESHVVKPSCCERCQRKLRGKDPHPTVHQVWHLPQVKPWVEQWLLHALQCHCGHVTRAKLPAGVPTGAFAPSVVAVTALLMGVCRLGKRVTQSVMADLFGLQMSLGAVIGCQKLASEALAEPVGQAVAHVQRARVKHADETSWRQGARRARAWMWVAVTRSVTVFKIQTQRSSEAAKRLLGKVKGTLVTDRYSGYGWWPVWARQICWSHLIRDFTAISERAGEAERIGVALLEEARRLFHWWHRVRDGTLSRKNFQVYVRSLKNRVRALLEQAQQCADQKTARTCGKLLRVFPAMWLFVEFSGVEPTNNCSERAIRHGVLWRKVSLGTHSEHGSRFVERILTTVATLRQQERQSSSGRNIQLRDPA